MRYNICSYDINLTSTLINLGQFDGTLISGCPIRVPLERANIHILEFLVAGISMISSTGLIWIYNIKFMISIFFNQALISLLYTPPLHFMSSVVILTSSFKGIEKV